MPIRGWELSRVLCAEESAAGESGGSGSGESSPSPSASESTSSYSAVDPGYTADAPEDSSGDELADLKAENTPPKTSADEAPAEPVEASTDAGGDAEESAESGDDFSDELLNRAVALGYTVADIKSFRSEKSLEKEISRVERIQQRLAAKTPEAAEIAPEPEPTVAPEEAAEPDWEQMVADGYDEKFVKMQQRTWQRAQAAEAGLRQIQQEHQRREFDAQVQRFDMTLANLGMEYESLFGAGSMVEVKKASPEMAQKRVEVFHKFQQLKNSYLMNQLPLPPEKELIEEAVHARFWKQTKTLARKELTNDIQKAGSQALSRPRSTGRQALTGTSNALAKEQTFWKKFS